MTTFPCFILFAQTYDVRDVNVKEGKGELTVVSCTRFFFENSMLDECYGAEEPEALDEIMTQYLNGLREVHE